ncbi:hypothetical protein C7M84_024125 [Penaeus vannamei]|uniref:Uncharacterized protein n=1 Tax=Penaeus vannamei TaxID=6689 RepID=A0A3R7QY29_PENVA|nr:hypothetical protein C7M84_024125 [Penaeus vannamei]
MHSTTSDYESMDSSLGSVSLANGSEPSSLTVRDSPEKSESLFNGQYSSLSPGYYNGYGYSKAPSPAPSWCSRKSHSPAPSGSWRRHRMHEGYSLPLDEFRMAAMQGNLPVIKALIKQGIAVDQILKSGWTCLMYACSSGKQHIVEYLLQQNADPNLHKEEEKRQQQRDTIQTIIKPERAEYPCDCAEESVMGHVCSRCHMCSLASLQA